MRLSFLTSDSIDTLCLIYSISKSGKETFKVNKCTAYTLYMFFVRAEIWISIEIEVKKKAYSEKKYTFVTCLYVYDDYLFVSPFFVEIVLQMDTKTFTGYYCFHLYPYSFWRTDVCPTAINQWTDE